MQAETAHFFRETSAAGALDCHIEPGKPFLDFSFRYVIGYTARCSLAQFKGAETRLQLFLRVTPQQGRTVLFAQKFTVPAIPDSIRPAVNLKHLKSEIQFTGSYAAGQGSYENELVIIDLCKRTARKKWTTRTSVLPPGDALPLALRPLRTQPASVLTWAGCSRSATRLHVTVLLDAASAWQFSATLRAGDRDFLLGALSSTLRLLPIASVHLVAFNLDQQREIFREDNLDPPALERLAHILANFDLGTISYQILQHENGWIDLLNNLLRSEAERTPHSDAIIFLGAAQRYRPPLDTEKFPITTLPAPCFYLEYSPHIGFEYPDAIERAINAFHAGVFRLHSPEDLALALKKMENTLQMRP